MDIEKLNPWNWFKHEDDSTSQIPVSKNDAPGESSSDNKSLTTPQNQAMGSLMKLHNEMDRLFDDVWRSFGKPSSSRLMRPSSVFGNSLLDNSILGDYRAKLDVSGSEKEYEVSIDLPGLTEDDIQIELNGNTLTVKGQKEEKSESKDKQYYRVERSIGSFQRTLSLPEDASRDEISANMKNGLLVIQIPRKALPKDDVKRISISS
ncbi:Hsp20/alpha crystallin family protein [Thalassomonas haliotis]|uniref:Hsp20/alpha crystallin family protein n=1 Tax=Thalassomonas haliotis TaxID=485448 RepID=A0ABY7VDX0_9GAMM|nr:Hsp20/alpha crystallin family protein [Thalassomonas haliotis]WDE11743.1 Hsp20/alpha crystallin family protein [Thalassomonas haliotis]